MWFSVIIATYNRAALLARCLESVFGQRSSDYELIVVDDGSTDETPVLLRHCGDRLRAIRQDNRGQATARNRGAGAARGEYLAFLDSDDLWFPWTLDIERRILDATGKPAVMLVQPVKLRDEAELVRFAPGEPRYQVFPDVYRGFARDTWFMGAGAMVLQRQAFLDRGGFPAVRTNSEDVDLLLKLGTAAKFVVVQSPPCVAYWQHAEAATGDLGSTYRGLCHLIRQWRDGRYPAARDGGPGAGEIVGRIARSTSLLFLQQRRFRLAWGVYRRMLRAHLAEGRWRYLAAFPPLAAWQALTARADPDRQAN